MTLSVLSLRWEPLFPHHVLRKWLSKVFRRLTVTNCMAPRSCARAERRQARADARIDLRERYEKYRNAWKKPDLHAVERFRPGPLHLKNRRPISGITRKTRICVSSCTTSWSLNVRSRCALRIALKAERQKLYDEGMMRPLSYRLTEQQALHGDQAALSLPGWSYRRIVKTGHRGV